MTILRTITDAIYAVPLTLLLIMTGMYFTIRTRGIQLRGLPAGIRALKRGGNLRAMLISTGARVGTGNIAGVAAAIAIGGPGAAFWMWLMALIGGATAFAENVLAVRHRRRVDGHWVGGAAYYMRSRGIAVAFTLALTACFGGAMNSLQAFQLQSTLSQYGVPPLLVAVVLTALTAVCLRGNAVGRWSEILVPFMTLGFLLLTGAIVFLKWELLPEVFARIFREAFAFDDFCGGMAGSAIAIGIRRGLFTNEAGMGSAPQAAASADCSHPAEQGMAQVLSVFIDTLVLCSATVLILLLCEVSPGGQSDVGWVQASVAAVLGPWARHWITAAMAVFAFTSILGGYFYTAQALTILTAPRRAESIAALLCLCSVFAGSLARAEAVWCLTDFCMAVMTLLNLAALWRLRHEAVDQARDWLKRSSR